MRDIPINEWGKDHWSCFAYFACCAMDYGGIIDSQRMRHDGVKYPTMLKTSTEPGHNDYNCLDDLEREGFVENHGTGINPIVKLTMKGLETWTQLTKHKQNGGMFKTFTVGT